MIGLDHKVRNIGLDSEISEERPAISIFMNLKATRSGSPLLLSYPLHLNAASSLPGLTSVLSSPARTALTKLA